MDRDILMDELSNLIRPYLEEKNLSREAFATKPEVSSSESTLRKLLNRQRLPNPSTIFRYIKAVTKQETLSDLVKDMNKRNCKEIEKFVLEKSPLYKESFHDQSLVFSYSDLSKDYITYCVYRYITCLDNPNLSDIKDEFGKIGIQKANNLAAHEIIKINDAGDISSHKAFSLDGDTVRDHAPKLIEQYSKADSPTNGIGSLGVGCEGLNDEGLNKAAIAAWSFHKEMDKIYNDEKYRGNIVAGHVFMFDTMTNTSYAPKKEGK